MDKKEIVLYSDMLGQLKGGESRDSRQVGDDEEEEEEGEVCVCRCC